MNDLESQIFEIFDKVVYNSDSGKSDDDMKLKKYIKSRAVDNFETLWLKVTHSTSASISLLYRHSENAWVCY